MTALEFAIVAPVFLALLFGALEISTQLLLQLNLEQSLIATGRDVIMGNISANSGDPRTAFVTELCNRAFLIPNCSATINVQMLSGSAFAAFTPATVTSGGQLSSTQFQAPVSGQVVLIQVSYPVPYPVPLGGKTSSFLIAQMPLQVEPY